MGGRRLRMTAEIGDWLAELGESDVARAVRIAAAVITVMESADPSSLPVVGDADDPAAAAGRAYQRLLEQLQRLRRRCADVATARKRAELRLQAEQQAGADPAVIAELEHALADARQRENRLTQRSQQLQQDVDAFRAARETAKAMNAAAEASRLVAELVAATEDDSGLDDSAFTEPVRAAEERLRTLAGRAGITAEPAPGLLELRADPLASDVRILFAAEPADTVTLLAVLDGHEAISEHRDEAVRLAGELLAEIRADGWPADLAEVATSDARAFLARFFAAGGSAS
jgi:hypothetical protein